MAYTGVKLDDVNKAIAAVKAAQKTYDDAASGIATSKAKVEKAKKDRDEALAKV